MSIESHILENIDLFAISEALEADPTTALMMVETVQGRPICFAITPWRGNIRPVQAEHLRILSADSCLLMYWSLKDDRLAILNIEVFPEPAAFPD
ncbi:MAG: hypothetical protein JSS66_10785 [Armatimonadetes bacterium]|nr:hypothetical protein [Armatimonadota bacterium]